MKLNCKFHLRFYYFSSITTTTTLEVRFFIKGYLQNYLIMFAKEEIRQIALIFIIIVTKFVKANNFASLNN